VSDECEELEAIESEFVLHPEVRPAVAKVKEPVCDEDGFVTHYEVCESICAVHTLQVGRGGWACEFEDGRVAVVPYENVRFIDGDE
jgi:hypothetical protein